MNESSDLDARRRHLVAFDDFEEWVAERAFPLTTKVTWIGIGVYLIMAILEFLQESSRPGMAESVPYRLGTLLCLVAMVFALKGTFSLRNRDIQASILGSLAQLCLIGMSTFALGRPLLTPVVMLFFLFGALVLAPALRLGVYLVACLCCDGGTLLLMLFSSQPVADLLVTVSIVIPAQGFLGYAVGSQRHYAQENWNLTRMNYLQATIDSLSQVLSRRAWYERSQAMMELSPRNPQEESGVAFIMLDIDHFKKVNDTWGHECGDLMIRRVADAIMQETREGDLVGRLGGEVFGILLVGTDPGVAYQTAERIRQRVENSQIEYQGNGVKITVSLGYCSSTSMIQEIDALIRTGDKCLYQAKKGGRNKVVGPS